MKNKHWTDFLVDSQSISNIFKEDKVIPNLDNIIIENMSLGFNLNSVEINFNFFMPINSTKKFKTKYNTTGGDLNFLDVSLIEINKKEINKKIETYSFNFTRIDHDKIMTEINGSNTSRLIFISKFITLNNFGGRLKEI